MLDKFRLGQKVIVNTGGKDSITIIDWTRHPLKHQDGETRIYQMEYTKKDNRVIEYSHCCRFTNNIEHTLYGGANPNSYSEKDFLVKSAQFIPESCIRPFSV